MKKTHGFCTKPTPKDDFVGHSCSVCGHTNIVHPGPHNPSLSQCLLCELEDLVRPCDQRLSEKQIPKLYSIKLMNEALTEHTFKKLSAAESLRRMYVDDVTWLLNLVRELAGSEGWDE